MFSQKVGFTLLVCLLLGAAPARPAAVTGWKAVYGGVYTDSANWVNGSINGVFDSTLVLQSWLTVQFNTNYTTPGDLVFNYTSDTSNGFTPIVFDSIGAPRTITLGGNVYFNPTDHSPQLMLESTYATSLNLGNSTRIFDVGNKAVIMTARDGTISNGGIDKRGVGKLMLYGSNSFAGGLMVEAGWVTLDQSASIGSGPVTLGDGAKLSATGTASIANPLTLLGDATLGDIYGSSLSLTGEMALGNVPHTVTMSGSITLSGPVHGSAEAALVLTSPTPGLPALVLAGANDFAGGVVLRHGAVAVANSAALGTGPLTIETGGQISCFGPLPVSLTGANAVPNAINVRGDFSLSDQSSGALEFSGPVDLGDATRSIAMGSPATFSGQISGAPGAGLVIATPSGAGSRLTLSHRNTFDGGLTAQTGAFVILLDSGAAGTGPLTLGLGTLELGPEVVIPNAVTLNGDATIGKTADRQASGMTGNIDVGAGSRRLYFSGSDSTLTLSGDLTGTADSSLELNSNSQGTIVLPNAKTYAGTVSLHGAFLLGHEAAAGVGPLVLSAGLQASTDLAGAHAIANAVTITTGFSVSGPHNFEFSGPLQLKYNASLGVSPGVSAYTGSHLLISGTISEGATASGFAISGDSQSSVTLTAANNYSGTTVVSGANLIVANTTGSATGTGAVTMATGKISGGGTLAGSVTIGRDHYVGQALLAPGMGLGMLELGALSFFSNGAYEFEFDSDTERSDQLLVHGAVSLGQAKLNLLDLGGAQLAEDDQFILIDNLSSAATTGTFLNLLQDAQFTLGKNRFSIDYAAVADADGKGNDVVVHVIPEPATGSLSAAGLTAAFACRRPRGRRRC